MTTIEDRLDELERITGAITEAQNDKSDRDLGNISPSSIGKSTITNWGIPDYTAGVATTTNSYTAPSVGFIQVEGGLNSWETAVLNINGHKVDRFRNVYSDPNASYGLQAFVSAGDVITVTNSKDTPQIIFYPLKGV